MTDDVRRFASGELGLPTTADPLLPQPDPSLPIMFTHIPRTAGFTLKKVLESLFGMRSVLLDAHYFDTSDVDLRQFKAVEGHKAPRYFRRSLGSGWASNGITLVRDPEARTVSYARLLRRASSDKRNAPVKSVVKKPAKVFEEMPVLQNQQTKILASRNQRSAEVGVDALNEAKATLDGISFGLTEQFDQSMCLIAERFSLVLPELQTTNASPDGRDEDLSGLAFREAARDYNQLDRDLYRYAEDLFHRRVSAYVSALLDMSFEERTLSWSLATSTGAPVETQVELAAGQTKVSISGWMLLDQGPADAVLITTGGRTIPAACRLFDSNGARWGVPGSRGVVGNRHAGLKATIDIPADADEITIVAMDRHSGLRGSRTVEVTRA